MKLNRSRILFLVALALFPLAGYPCLPESVEVNDPDDMILLEEWLERLEDGWVPVSLVEAVLEDDR
jgi:hypothetical protein